MENNFNIPAEVGKLKVRGNIEIVAGIVLAAAGLISMAKLTVDFFVYINTIFSFQIYYFNISFILYIHIFHFYTKNYSLLLPFPLNPLEN